MFLSSGFLERHMSMNSVALEGRKKNRKKKNDGNMNDYAVGIDIGEKESVATYMSPSGDIIEQFTFSMNSEGYKEFREKIPSEARIAFEASGMAYVVFNSLKSMGYDSITVAHPKELSWIVKSKKKNDRVDSLKLAKLHLVNMLPESYLLSEEDRIFRDLLIQRAKLGQEIAKVKTSIISYLKREGLFDSLPEISENFSDKRRKAMESIKFNNDKDVVFKTMLNRLKFLEDQIPPLEERIKSRARECEDVKLLMTIPGIDYYLARLLSSYIGDVHRFPNESKLASFFGIVPSNRDSSSLIRRGHMSKEGASTARWALSMAVDTVKIRNKPIMEYYNHQKERMGSGKLAHVLTMRKLIRMIYFMLSNRKPWKYENIALTERKVSDLEDD